MLHLVHYTKRVQSPDGHSCSRPFDEVGINQWTLAVLVFASFQEWAARAHMSVEELEAEMVEGKRAVQHLVRSNIRLVLSIARKYRSEFVDYSDLIQVCFLPGGGM